MKYKNKTNKIFSIAITAIMLLSVFAAMMPATATAMAMGMAAIGESKSVEEAQAQTSFDIDNPAAFSFAEKEEEHEKEIQRIHKERLERFKQMPKQPGTLHVHVWVLNSSQKH